MSAAGTDRAGQPAGRNNAPLLISGCLQSFREAVQNAVYRAGRTENAGRNLAKGGKLLPGRRFRGLGSAGGTIGFLSIKRRIPPKKNDPFVSVSLG